MAAVMLHHLLSATLTPWRTAGSGGPERRRLRPLWFRHDLGNNYNPESMESYESGPPNL